MTASLATPLVPTSPSGPDAIPFAHTCAGAPEEAARQLADRLLSCRPSGVLFFCSAEYDLDALGQALERHFGGVPLCGCTTAGELTTEGYARGGVVAIGFPDRDFAFAHAVIDDLDNVSLPAAQTLVDTLLGECQAARVAPLKGHSFAVTLLDGLSASEEQVLATLNAALAGIPHFGGSAGDDKLGGTHVYGGGRFHSAAAAVVMLNTRLDFEVFSTHHLRPRSEKLVVTAVDRERRRVLELNAEPAALEYARLVGVPVEALDAEVFARHPLAVKLNERSYVRAIQRVNPDHSLSFYCAVENGIVLTAMAPTPLLGGLEAGLETLAERLGEPGLVIGCDCCLRRLEVNQDGLLPQARSLLSRYRVVGFNTYGEHYDGLHLNQTFTGVYLGRPPRTRPGEQA